MKGLWFSMTSSFDRLSIYKNFYMENRIDAKQNVRHKFVSKLKEETYFFRSRVLLGINSKPLNREYDRILYNLINCILILILCVMQDESSPTITNTLVTTRL